MALVWVSKRTDSRDGDIEMAGRFKALGHPKRLEIVRILQSRGSSSCGELVSELDLAQSTVSQHLDLLRRGGLLARRVRGTRSEYRLQAEVLAAVRDYLDTMARDRPSTTPH